MRARFHLLTLFISLGIWASPVQGGELMLSHSRTIHGLATKDLDHARAFYVDKLGLPLVREEPGVLVLETGGTTLRISKIPTMTPAPFSVLSWEVSDIRGAIGKLVSKGITFERIASVPQDDLAIWTAPDKTQVAWFKDPDGNILAVVQRP